MTLFIQLLFVLHILFSLLYFMGYLRLKTGFKFLDYKIGNPDETPSVSIIISLRNEESNIPDLINHLKLQKYPQSHLEIIFIDDRSEDRTYELLSQNKISEFQVKVIKIENLPPDTAPKKHAITTAVAQASGEILLFTDADGRPGPYWVKSMVSLFSPETGMVLGYAPYSTQVPYSTTIFRMLALEYLSHAAISAASTGLRYPVTCVGTNLAYRKSVFEQLSGFGKFITVHTGDDDLFLQRVREESDWQIRYASDEKSHVFNAPPDNVAKFYNQRLRYASKGLMYPLKLKVSLVLYYLYNLLFLTNLFFILINPVWISAYAFTLLIKFMADYLFMLKAARVLHDQRQTSLIPVALLIHIPYVVYFGLVAQFQSFKWGGRRG